MIFDQRLRRAGGAAAPRKSEYLRAKESGMCDHG
ncbi:hypothetical protein SAMN05444287_1280 [Octadecabacter temperatus]|uniref:Uncharacterized protein n=1 Tax=Octadecabacter temperatus TaxID=1458307 RepID=A0A0K0Y5N7_9RHOB|nr:hypothetical protein OSB_16230 [Octadecabacter temperatus]SIO08951.1 hypothetical protein SAMN05444287_1280 [Octadecabacter temperatus]